MWSLLMFDYSFEPQTKISIFLYFTLLLKQLNLASDTLVFVYKYGSSYNIFSDCHIYVVNLVIKN